MKINKIILAFMISSLLLPQASCFAMESGSMGSGSNFSGWATSFVNRLSNTQRAILLGVLAGVLGLGYYYVTHYDFQKVTGLDEKRLYPNLYPNEKLKSYTAKELSDALARVDLAIAKDPNSTQLQEFHDLIDVYSASYRIDRK